MSRDNDNQKKPTPAESAELLGVLEGKLKINGDIISTGVTWDAQS